MITIEFGGNTLANKDQDANALHQPEKPANSASTLHSVEPSQYLQAEINNQPTRDLFAPLRKWIAENLWKN